MDYNYLIEPLVNKKVTLGCSGGPDSMFLLSLLVSSQFNHQEDLLVVHINYHFRSNSDQDQRVVVNYCQQQNIPCLVIHNHQQLTSNVNLQSFARKFRFYYFQHFAAQNHALVLLAHHEDDDLITFLLQKQRNILPSYYGLKKISQYQDILVHRPLLSVSKKDILHYLNQQKINYAVDQSNFNSYYLRNKVTKDYQQQLIQQNFRYQTKQKIKQHNLKLQQDQTLASQYLQQNQEKFCCNYQSLFALQKQVQYLILRDFINHKTNNNFVQLQTKFLDSIIQWLKTTKKVSYHHISKQWVLISCYGWLFVVKTQFLFPSFQDCSLDDLKVKDYLQIKLSNPNKLRFGFVVNHAQYQLSFSFGHKSINKHLKDLKVPALIRNIFPLVIEPNQPIKFKINSWFQQFADPTITYQLSDILQSFLAKIKSGNYQPNNKSSLKIK